MKQPMTKKKKITFNTEGPDWTDTVDVDVSIFEDERSQLIEAATRSIENQIKNKEDLNLGAIILVKQSGKKDNKEAMVNAYLCLVNAGQYDLAEKLRVNFKQASGQDLSVDQNGYSY